MKKFEDSHVNASGTFPDTLAVDATGPSATDGTEWIKLGIDDWWGWSQALLSEGGVTPSGTTETATTSDMLDAMKSLFFFDSLITGLVCSNNVTDSDHDIDVATGKAMDSTNAFLMKLTSGLIKQIDASWAVGTNAGGLFTGAVAIDTWYHVFLIRKDSDGTIDVGFDTSVSAANIPGGYTAFRRIGSVLTDGLANILAFDVTELAGGAINVDWDAAVNDVSATMPLTRTLYTLSVPLDIKTEAKLLFQVGGSTTIGYSWIKPTNTTDVVPSNTDFDVNTQSNKGSGEVIKRVFSDTSSQVAVRGTLAIGFVEITQGFVDNRV